MFVAECDIKGFFDCVSHEVARASVDELIRDARRKRSGLTIHPRALEIFDSYLRGYSFLRNIKRRQSYLLANRDRLGEFRWPIVDLRAFHNGAEPDDVGVPQGGALSCFIANAVLHGADKQLDRLRRAERKAYSYLRYCDDMILLSRDEAVCNKAFECYQRSLKEKLLPVHPPVAIEGYSPGFWEGKSKAPYRWGSKKADGEIPWIQFVGYQIRHDGLVRVRPSSIEKQRKKITRVADELLKVLNPGPRTGRIIPPFAATLRKTNRQILHRLRQKLISMAVGRVRLGREELEPLPMCWASGFRGLVGKQITPLALKRLDNHRERQIQRVSRRLKLRKNERSHDSQARSVLRYYGRPFSYWGQFNHSVSAPKKTPSRPVVGPSKPSG